MHNDLNKAITAARAGLALLEEAADAMAFGKPGLSPDRFVAKVRRKVQLGLSEFCNAALAAYGGELTKPLSDLEIRKKAVDGKIRFVLGIPFEELATIARGDDALEGLNEWVDDTALAGDIFDDMRYQVLAADILSNRVYFLIDADCTEILDSIVEEEPLDDCDC